MTRLPLMTVCKRVLYRGRVQGVGFRYTTLGIAKRHNVTGFVRNLANGRVELVAEGEAAEVERFLRAVADGMGGYVEHQDVSDETPQGFEGFAIRH